MMPTGYTDGANRLERPSHLGGLNPKCRNCDHWQRGGNPCVCDAPDFPNERLPRLHDFQVWCEAWSVECLRVLKPGGYILAFGGTRTSHRLACAIEDAGFEIRDSIAWLYGSGFPKSLDVSKAIDKAAGAEREVVGPRGRPDGSAPRKNVTGSKFGSMYARDEYTLSMSGNDPLLTAPATPDARAWQGWGTALKPAFEPIVVGRKPLVGTVAANVLAYGTGALNIDGCRVGMSDSDREKFIKGDAAWREMNERRAKGRKDNEVYGEYGITNSQPHDSGRWPANVVLDGSQADALDAQSGTSQSRIGKPRGAVSGDGWGMTATGAEYDDQGGPSRYFPTFRYEAKAPTTERPRAGDVAHPTVKPLDLMRWLVRLVTPRGGTVLEPFAGSGTTAEACILEGFKCIAIEREADYLPLIVQRISKPLQVGLNLNFGETA
jgi:site-specific DNA-methyltransferase (adenine-specific)